jgi:transposase
MIRFLRVARRGAMKARIQAGAQLDALIVTAPEPVRAPLRKLSSKQRIRACAALRPGSTAGQLLVTAGDNRDRLRSEASFARLCGAAPIPVSSGRTDRHRLHRGGDRQGNSALWRIALVRMGCHQPTKDYVARRTAEGKTKTEIMRCLKRYIAREVFPHLLTATPAAACGQPQASQGG